MDADYQAFRAALADNPADWRTRLLLADWYEENGYDWKAFCQRWLVEKRLHPDSRKSYSGIYILGWWWLEAINNAQFSRDSALPFPYEEIVTNNLHLVYDSVEEAEDTLAWALPELLKR